MGHLKVSDYNDLHCMQTQLIVILTIFPPPHATGTSTDVSRYAGQYEHVFEATTAGVTLQAPQLDINTVAAGGGSRLFFRSVICQQDKLVDV